MKFTVERSKWLRGEGGHNSKLLCSQSGKMCCLGFFALSQGAAPEDIQDKRTPENIQHDWTKPLVTAQHINTAICDSLMIVNDSTGYGESREQMLKEMFARIGVEVEFVD